MEYSKIVDIKRLNFITDTLKANLPADAHVLDVGCGNGIISRHLGKTGFTIKGIDVSEDAIAKASNLNNLPNVSFEVVNAEKLVADNHKYHAIVCSEVLEHLHDPGSFLAVLSKILRPDGVLIVTVPNGKGPRETFVTKPMIALQKKQNWVWKTILRVKKAFGYNGTTVQSDAGDLTHLQFFTPKALNKLAEENKFKIVTFNKTNFVEDVFPFSLLTNRIKILQKIDCSIVEILPLSFTGGFMTVWTKVEKK